VKAQHWIAPTSEGMNTEKMSTGPASEDMCMAKMSTVPSSFSLFAVKTLKCTGMRAIDQEIEALVSQRRALQAGASGLLK